MPSIKEKPEKSKYVVLFVKNVRFFIGVSLLFIIVALFGSFRLMAIFKSRNVLGIQVVSAAFPSNLSGKEGAYVGAKSGKSYYFPWCGSVKRIKSGNLVWFQDRAVAEAKGYKPAGNCHGLK
jgi:hypothetical protein